LEINILSQNVHELESDKFLLSQQLSQLKVAHLQSQTDHDSDIQIQELKALTLESNLRCVNQDIDEQFDVQAQLLMHKSEAEIETLNHSNEDQLQQITQLNQLNEKHLTVIQKLQSQIDHQSNLMQFDQHSKLGIESEYQSLQKKNETQAEEIHDLDFQLQTKIEQIQILTQQSVTDYSTGFVPSKSHRLMNDTTLVVDVMDVMNDSNSNMSVSDEFVGFRQHPWQSSVPTNISIDSMVDHQIDEQEYKLLLMKSLPEEDEGEEEKEIVEETDVGRHDRRSE
jgi:hypothetical protein